MASLDQPTRKILKHVSHACTWIPLQRAPPCSRRSINNSTTKVVGKFVINNIHHDNNSHS